MSDEERLLKGEILLPSLFGDHMVLQQQVVTRLLGQAEPDQSARLLLERLPADGRPILPQDSQYGVVFEDLDRTDAQGFFDFRLPRLAASFDPYRLTLFVGEHKRELQDILVGEVWLVGGAASMALPLSESDFADRLERLANAEHLRLFKTPESGLTEEHALYAYEPQGSVPGLWKKGDETKAIAEVSAVGLIFARELRVALDCPVGLIDVACPGSYMHSWLPREVVEDDTFLKGRAREVKQYRDRDNWNRLTPDKPKPGELKPQAEMKARRPHLVGNPLTPHPFDPKNQPSALFNHKLAPFIGTGLRGVLWAPGENEVDAPEPYMRGFLRLADTIQELFAAPEDRPAILFTQLPPGDFPDADFRQLAVFNEMLTHLRRRLSLPAGYVTVYDLPLAYGGGQARWDSPYYTLAKSRVGVRLKQIALGLVYGHDLPGSVPEPKAMEVIGNKLMLDFDQVGATGQGLQIRNDEEVLKGFAICGEDRVFVPAMARILHGVRLIVWHDDISDPVSLTYAFANFSGDANLVSAENLPVPPFRMDLEPSVYARPLAWSDCDRLEAFAWPKKAAELRRIRREDWPGEKALWKVETGRGELALSSEQARWGRQSLFLTYKNADSRPIVIEPQLHYASSYPPLNIAMWKTLSLHIFNADHGQKTVALHLEDANQVRFTFEARPIEATYRFQEIRFPLHQAAVNREQIVRLSLIFADARGRGELHLDRLALLDLDTTKQ